MAILALTARGQAPALSPPPEPEVPPLIGEAYPTDADRDRVEDRLVAESARLEALALNSVSALDRALAGAQLASGVEVELIFNRQISQEQIDTFLAMDGEITYLYRSVSYGWNGRIPLSRVVELPQVMGAALVLVQQPAEAVLHLDVATQTARVRPVWTAGFAGNVSGYDGSTDITIAVIDTGVDEGHTDLSGRRVFWQDFTPDGNASPIDMIHHGSHVTGIALGSGASGGADSGTLYYSANGTLGSGVSSGSFYPDPIGLPASSVTVTSTARWTGGGSTTLYLVSRPKGGGSWTAVNWTSGTSNLTLTTTLTGDSTKVYSAALLSVGNNTVSNYVVLNQVSGYPGVGDGFNRMRGVAPGCNWAGAKVFRNDGSGLMSYTDSAIDTLVANRVAKQIKVMNLSLGATGSPGLSTTTRQKVNSAVNNGVLMVISAGNDGGNASPSSRQVDDPGRAAMALTVAAANDVNQLTSYSSEGFTSPGSTSGQEEDYKPDLMAPGGSSSYYTSMLSVDSGSGDGGAFSDQQSNDYTGMQGTSMASPFAAGSAALVIDALQQGGTNWDFTSSRHARLVKMVLCATSSESNANREGGNNNPTLQRATDGPNGFPAGKDRYEGYGMINVDAAVAAVATVFPFGSTNVTLGANATDARVWASTVNLTNGQTFRANLTVPGAGDYDLYLYSGTPAAYGTPVILTNSTQAGNGTAESLVYLPTSNTTALLVVKRVSGSGAFTLSVPTPSANLAVAMSDAPDPVNQGSNVVYSLTVTNAGPDGAASVVLTDALPASLTFVSATTSRGTYAQNSGTVSFDFGVLSNTASVTATITAQTTARGSVTNTAQVSSVTADAASGDNSASNITSVNAPPVPTNPALGTKTNQPVTFSVVKLASDPDGDTMSFTVNSPSAHGTIALVGDNVTYTPAANYSGSDSFTYTANDGRGGTTNGTVSVTVNTGTAVSLNIVSAPAIQGGNFVVRFAGVPGRTYTIEWSDNATGPWAKSANRTAPRTSEGFGVGVFEYSEPAGVATTRFFRTVYPAY